MATPKSILMPLSSSGHERERLLGALSVTSYFQGHLEVMHAQVSPRQFIPDDAVARSIPHNLLHELEALADKYSLNEATELHRLFESLCAERAVRMSETTVAGTATACWHEISGLRSELVGERGKVADLIVVPQPRNGNPTATFEAAVMRSGKPVLLVPRQMTCFDAKRVLIAWNGSTEGSRAVTAALPLLRQAESVVVATSLNSAQRKPTPEDLIRYLAHHEVRANVLTFDSGQGAGAGLVDLALDTASDLMVMGAFTHRRVHEQIFGGVTRFMVAHARIPVLMMH